MRRELRCASSTSKWDLARTYLLLTRSQFGLLFVARTFFFSCDAITNGGPCASKGLLLIEQFESPIGFLHKRMQLKYKLPWVRSFGELTESLCFPNFIFECGDPRF